MSARQELLRTRPWTQLKRAARVEVGDVVHTPSGPMVVCERLPASVPKGNRVGRVVFRVKHFNAPGAPPTMTEARWQPHEELLTLGKAERQRMDLWAGGGPSAGSYRVPAAESDGRLF